MLKSVFKHTRKELMAGAAMVAVVMAAGGAQARQLDMEAQPVGQALSELASQTGVQFLYFPATVEGRTTKAVKGDYELKEALKAMLMGSGLDFVFTDENTVTIRPAEGARNTSDASLAEPGGADDADSSSRTSFVLEEIIVTAEKRAESLQDLPIAISAFSGEKMKSAGVEGVYSLQQIAPSLQVGGGYTGNTFVSVRGIGSEVPSIGGESGVAISQDGVVFGRNMFFDASFMDVQRVELLRGPQGTISGRNATGGGINVYSNKPTDEFEGQIKATLGSYKRFATEGYVSGPIVDDVLLGRFAFSTDNADGWLKNTYLNEEEEDRRQVHARAYFLARFSDTLEAHLIFEGVLDKSTPQGAYSRGKVRADQPSPEEVFDVPAPDFDNLTFQSELSQHGRKEQYGTTLKLNWDISPSVSLASTTGYWSLDINASSDYESLLVSLASNPQFNIDVWQLTQEFTLTADLTDRLDLILGGLYLKENAKEPLVFVSLPTDISAYEVSPDQDLTSYSAYTQLRYQLTEALRVSAGVRYTYDKKTYVDEQASNGFPLGILAGSNSWNAITPRVAIDYDINSDMTIFANVARGFKAGGFNTFGNPVDDFNPEFVWNYEAGLKADLLEDRLRLAVTGFYADYTNLQQNVFGSEGSILPSIQNAGGARIKGLELETEFLVAEGVRFNFAGTYLDAKFTELQSGDALFPELGALDPVSGINVRDLAGNRLVRTPKLQFNAGAEYSRNVGKAMIATLRADYQWQSHMFFNFFNHDLVDQGAYGLLNLSAVIESEDGIWQVGAYARNILDERYFSHGFTSGLAVNLNQVNIGAPRTYGISLMRRF